MAMNIINLKGGGASAPIAPPPVSDPEIHEQLGGLDPCNQLGGLDPCKQLGGLDP